MTLAEPPTSGRGARLAARAEALATRRNATLAAVLAGIVVLVLGLSPIVAMGQQPRPWQSTDYYRLTVVSEKWYSDLDSVDGVVE